MGPLAALRAAKATRAHSTVAKHPVEGDVDVGLAAGFVVTLGDVATRFRARGCIGESGADVERRNVRFAELCRTSPPVCFEGVDGAGAGGFAASVRDLIVALMTCVARAALSREFS